MSKIWIKEKEYAFYLGEDKIVILEAVLSDQELQVTRHLTLRNPEGFKQGLVVDLEKAFSTLESVSDSFFETPYEGRRCFVVLGNSKLKAYSYSSCQYYQGAARQITPHEIRNVIHQTKSIATLPLSEHILQAVPESFLINDMKDIRNPIGLEAERLGVHLKLFTMNFQDFRNIARAFESAEIEIKSFFPKTMTSSEAVLSDEEKNEGVVLIDISGSSTELTLWRSGALRDMEILESGQNSLTEAISAKWEIDFHDAVKVKEKYASLEQEKNFEEELIPLIERNGKGSYSIYRKAFQEGFLEFYKAWVEKILLSADEFAKKGEVHYPHYVFTGEGANLNGFIEYLTRQFSRVARVGLARHVDAPNELLVDPSMVPALGAMRWLNTQGRDQSRLLAPVSFVEKAQAWARDWFSNYF